MWGFPAAQWTSRAQDEAFSPPTSRVPTQEALRALLHSSAVYGDGSSTAPYRAELLALPDSRVQATPDLARREDSEYLVELKEKILLSSEEFLETVGSEDVHVDPALKRASVHKRFIWRLLSLGMVRLSLGSECECGTFLCLEKEWNPAIGCGCQEYQPTMSATSTRATLFWGRPG